MEFNTLKPQETRSVDLHDLYLTENNTLTSDAYKDWKEGKLDLELAKCYVHRLCHHTASFYEELTLTRRELTQVKKQNVELLKELLSAFPIEWLERDYIVKKIRESIARTEGVQTKDNALNPHPVAPPDALKEI